jgi:hypothetical protein
MQCNADRTLKETCHLQVLNESNQNHGIDYCNNI